MTKKRGFPDLPPKEMNSTHTLKLLEMINLKMINRINGAWSILIHGTNKEKANEELLVTIETMAELKAALDYRMTELSQHNAYWLECTSQEQIKRFKQIFAKLQESVPYSLPTILLSNLEIKAKE